jgi:hypothetical protein
MRVGIIRILKRKTNILLFATGLLVACAPSVTQNSVAPQTDTQTPEKRSTAASEATDTDAAENTITPEAETTQAATPTSTESGGSRFDDFIFQPLLPFDAIRPIYEPQFVTGDEAPFDEEELVMGVAIQGEAKAYPVSVLRFREMVDDELGGLPILVTW